MQLGSHVGKKFHGKKMDVYCEDTHVSVKTGWSVVWLTASNGKLDLIRFSSRPPVNSLRFTQCLRAPLFWLCKMSEGILKEMCITSHNMHSNPILRVICATRAPCTIAKRREGDRFVDSHRIMLDRKIWEHQSAGGLITRAVYPYILSYLMQTLAYII